MLWSDPWLQLATSVEGTRIPPPKPPPLPASVTFSLQPASSSSVTEEWLTFIRSGFSVTDALHRLAFPSQSPSQIACLRHGEKLLATCVLREKDADTWNLEAFAAWPRGHRNGELLLRHMIWSMWSPRFCLTWTWELPSTAALLSAWWRGWITPRTSFTFGWRWRSSVLREACGFCPVSAAWTTPTSRLLAAPGRVLTIGGGITVADSGQADGWGFVLRVRGPSPVDWEVVAAAGGWRELWCDSATEPLSTGNRWTWTGEWICHGSLGCVSSASVTRFPELTG